MQLTINLPNDIGRRMRRIPNTDKFISEALEVALLLLEREHRTLDEIARDITSGAKRQGLTDEKLEELLKDAE